MYSPAACPPCQAKITPVNATPMAIHTDDSIAASLNVISWAVRCTRSRSTMISAAMNAMNAAHCQA